MTMAGNRNPFLSDMRQQQHTPTLPPRIGSNNPFVRQQSPNPFEDVEAPLAPPSAPFMRARPSPSPSYVSPAPVPVHAAALSSYPAARPTDSSTPPIYLGPTTQDPESPSGSDVSWREREFGWSGATSGLAGTSPPGQGQALVEGAKEKLSGLVRKLSRKGSEGPRRNGRSTSVPGKERRARNAEGRAGSPNAVVAEASNPVPDQDMPAIEESPVSTLAHRGQRREIPRAEDVMTTGNAIATSSAPRRQASPDGETNKENRRPSPTAVTFTSSSLQPPPASSSPPTSSSTGIGGIVRRLSRKTSRGRRPAPVPAALADESVEPRTPRVRPKSAAPVLESLDVGAFNNSPTPGGDDGDLPEGGSVRFGSGAQFGGAVGSSNGTNMTNGSGEEEKGGLSNLVRKMSRKLAVKPSEPYSGARARSRTVGNNAGYTPPVHRGDDGSWVHTPKEERDFSHIPLHKPPSFLNMAGTGALSSFAPRPPLKPATGVAGPSSPRHGRSPLSSAPVNGHGSDDEREEISEKEREAFGDPRARRPPLRSYASTPSYRTISSLEEREREREREEMTYWRNQGRAHAHPGTANGEVYANRQVADNGSAIWGGNGAGDDMAF